LYYHVVGQFNIRTLNNRERYVGHSGIGKRKDLVVFSDLTPFMLMTESSMDDLNSRTPNGEQFNIKNFRPNFVVTGTSPYDEDSWNRVRIGDNTEFTNVKSCTRCLLTTINYQTGEKHPKEEPLRTLRSYRVCREPEAKKYERLSPRLGLNLALDRTGTVRVGDKVYVTYKNK